jgi:hypothetical protein
LSPCIVTVPEDKPLFPEPGIVNEVAHKGFLRTLRGIRVAGPGKNRNTRVY